MHPSRPYYRRKGSWTGHEFRRTGKSIAGTGKKATLELGGKAANIIFADATIDQAVEGIINGIYRGPRSTSNGWRAPLSSAQTRRYEERIPSGIRPRSNAV